METSLSASPTRPGINISSRPPSFEFFFSFLLQLSLPLWLRSSVVSVLFSLISESILRNTKVIILIFVPRD